MLFSTKRNYNVTNVSKSSRKFLTNKCKSASYTQVSLSSYSFFYFIIELLNKFSKLKF